MLQIFVWLCTLLHCFEPNITTTKLIMWLLWRVHQMASVDPALPDPLVLFISSPFFALLKNFCAEVIFMLEVRSLCAAVFPERFLFLR